MSYNSKFRTDLAVESADTGDNLLPEGVFVEEEKTEGITKTVVRITTDGASERLGRPKGNYITLDGSLDNSKLLISLLSKELSQLLPDGPVLVVGLGNRMITPDTLGPDVVQKIIATRHISEKQRVEIGLEKIRDVCALAPGAMGQTGIETASIISMITKDLSFSAVIAVDALAARSAERLGRTIQLANSGISPGSGVHNSRATLSEETLGVPVFSIGIPTVVDAKTLVSEYVEVPNESPFSSMIVTSRDIDQLILQGTNIVATAINCALFPSLSTDDITLLMS